MIDTSEKAALDVYKILLDKIELRQVLPPMSDTREGDSSFMFLDFPFATQWLKDLHNKQRQTKLHNIWTNGQIPLNEIKE